MSARRGFTLLEVVIALAILAVSLMVLVDSQTGAVLTTVEAQKTLTGTWLAQEKMAEAMLRVERDGFTTADIDEEGDFSEMGQDMGMGEDVDFGDDFEDYKWAYTIRRVDIRLGDMGGAAEQLQSSGYGVFGEEQDGSTTTQPQADERDLGDLGVQPDMISEMLRPYLREVRVMVWWGDEEPDLEEGCESCIEIVTHVINPTGAETSLEGDGQAGGSSSGGTSGGSSGGSATGGGTSRSLGGGK